MPGDLGAGFLAHQRIVARRQLALGGLGIGLVKRLGQYQPQHPVAEEFQPLIVAPRPAHRRMGQGPHQQVGPGEIMAQPPGEIAQLCRQFHRTTLQIRSPRQSQRAQNRPLSLDRMTSRTRPRTSSRATKPIPPEPSGNRLSRELSRLSPRTK